MVWLIRVLRWATCNHNVLQFLLITCILFLRLPFSPSLTDVIIIIPLPSLYFLLHFDLPLQVFMSSLVKDKFEKHLIMMEQNGLSRWTYWLVTYTFNYILYIPIAVEISILSYAFKMRVFTQVGAWMLFMCMRARWYRDRVI